MLWAPWVGPGKPNLPLGLRGKAGGGARVTAGPKRPHLSVCSGIEPSWRYGPARDMGCTWWGTSQTRLEDLFQARILEWVAFPFSRGSSPPTQGSNPGLPHCRRILYQLSHLYSGKESASNVGDRSSIPESGRSPGRGNGNPLQDSCLGNHIDRGVWWARVHGVLPDRTQVSCVAGRFFTY